VLDGAFPYHTEHPLENTYGMIVYSRLPVPRSEVKFLVEPDIPSIYSLIQLRSGDLVEVIAIHPRPPQPIIDTAERDTELFLVGRQAKVSRDATIVGGDVNDVGWSQTTTLFQRVSGLLDRGEAAGGMRRSMPSIPSCAIPWTISFMPRHFGCGAWQSWTISDWIIFPSSSS
jgi:endonuclease/exonuclease/phosphatase (EEP) superfamily protein YafD